MSNIKKEPLPLIIKDIEDFPILSGIYEFDSNIHFLGGDIIEKKFLNNRNLLMLVLSNKSKYLTNYLHLNNDKKTVFLQSLLSEFEHDINLFDKIKGISLSMQLVAENNKTLFPFDYFFNKVDYTHTTEDNESFAMWAIKYSSYLTVAQLFSIIEKSDFTLVSNSNENILSLLLNKYPNLYAIKEHRQVFNKILAESDLTISNKQKQAVALCDYLYQIIDEIPLTDNNYHKIIYFSKNYQKIKPFNSDTTSIYSLLSNLELHKNNKEHIQQIFSNLHPLLKTTLNISKVEDLFKIITTNSIVSKRIIGFDFSNPIEYKLISQLQSKIDIHINETYQQYLIDISFVPDSFSNFKQDLNTLFEKIQHRHILDNQNFIISYKQFKHTIEHELKTIFEKIHELSHLDVNESKKIQLQQTLKQYLNLEIKPQVDKLFDQVDIIIQEMNILDLLVNQTIEPITFDMKKIETDFLMGPSQLPKTEINITYIQNILKQNQKLFSITESNSVLAFLENIEILQKNNYIGLHDYQKTILQNNVEIHLPNLLNTYLKLVNNTNFDLTKHQDIINKTNSLFNGLLPNISDYSTKIDVSTNKKVDDLINIIENKFKKNIQNLTTLGMFHNVKNKMRLFASLTTVRN